MPFSWVGPAISIGSALLGADASKSAANTQADAARHAADTQWQMFDTVNKQQAPWRQAGQNALSTISDMQPQFTHSFGADDLKTNLAPNYQFQLDQGLGATKNAANMQTGLVSGNAMKGINDYAQNFAGNAYQQAFNNYNAQQSNIFNRLSNIAGLGQTANQTTATAGTTLAGGIGNAQIAAGQAQGSGQIGVAQNIAGGANNALGWYTLPQLMNYGGTSGGQGSGGATGGGAFAE